MEEFEKIDWLPNIEDVVDKNFVNEERMQADSATYQILNGMFNDPFEKLRPRPNTSKQGTGTDKMMKKDIAVAKPRKRTKKKKGKKKQ